MNTVSEAADIVRAVDHPNFRCLVDSYHFWLEDEPLESLREAMPLIRHVHVADRAGRVPPGESGDAKGSDYRALFRILEEARYDALISVESPTFTDIAKMGPRV